jgi:hypothetical protein
LQGTQRLLWTDNRSINLRASLKLYLKSSARLTFWSPLFWFKLQKLLLVESSSPKKQCHIEPKSFLISSCKAQKISRYWQLPWIWKYWEFEEIVYLGKAITSNQQKFMFFRFWFLNCANHSRPSYFWKELNFIKTARNLSSGRRWTNFCSYLGWKRYCINWHMHRPWKRKHWWFWWW